MSERNSPADPGTPPGTPPASSKETTVTEKTLTPADQAFYEWFHVQGRPAYIVAMDQQRDIFMAGWTARMEAEGND
jgi:hypothetical protein